MQSIPAYVGQRHVLAEVEGTRLIRRSAAMLRPRDVLIADGVY
jgi:hypothetical protein